MLVGSSRQSLDEFSPRQRCHQGRVFERQLQGRARRDRRGEDHAPLSAHRRRRRGGHGRVESPIGAFRPGDPVLVTGYDLGVAHDGGYAAYVRVPAEWVVPIPDGLSLFDVMAIGTAGFTAALSIVEMERNGLAPGQRSRDRDRRDGRRRQYRGRVPGGARIRGDRADRQGARSTSSCARWARRTCCRERRCRWARGRSRRRCGQAPSIPSAATSSPGSRERWCTAAASRVPGLPAGTELKTTVLPFILRGVKLLGIDSVMCPAETRLEVWRRLATDLRPTHLGRIANLIGLDDLPPHSPRS